MPKIDVSDAVFEALRKRAEPFVDASPNDVLERLLGVSRPRRTKRRRGASVRHDRRKLAPIVAEVLYEMGGQGRVKEVIDRVRERLVQDLTDHDRQTVGRGNYPRPRWEMETLWARDNLKNEGWLERPETSGRGVWKLTPHGIRQIEAANGD